MGILYADPSDLVPADNSSAGGGGGGGGRKRSKVTSSKSSSSGKARKSSNSDSTADLGGIGGRDSSLFLFRALGKILYCKRESSSSRLLNLGTCTATMVFVCDVSTLC